MRIRRVLGIVMALILGLVIYKGTPYFDNWMFGSNYEDTGELGAHIEEVELVRVIDGDTIVIQSDKDTEETVRFLLIDTPETVHPEREEEIFGKEARRYVEQSLGREGNTIYIERGEEEIDKYGRTLAYVYATEPIYFEEVVTESVNAGLVRNGLARIAYVYEPNTKYLQKFRDFERYAQGEKLYIWSIPKYVTDDGFDMNVVSDKDKEKHKIK